MQGDWDQRHWAQDESSVSKWVCGINAFLFSEEFTEFTGPTGPTVRGEAPIESYMPLGQPWRHGGRGDVVIGDGLIFSLNHPKFMFYLGHGIHGIHGTHGYIVECSHILRLGSRDERWAAQETGLLGERDAADHAQGKCHLAMLRSSFGNGNHW